MKKNKACSLALIFLMLFAFSCESENGNQSEGQSNTANQGDKVETTGSASSAGDKEKVGEPDLAFEKTLGNFDPGKCTNITRAIQSFVLNFEKATPEKADEGFKALDRFIDKCVATANQKLWARKDLADFSLLGYNPDKKAVPKHVTGQVAKWKSCGFALDFPEGDVQIVRKPGFENAQVLPLVSPAMQAFLKQTTKERRNWWASDGGLTITWQELAERAIFWDNFEEEYLDFDYQNMPEAYWNQYSSVISTGLDNTPIFAWEKPYKVLPEVIAAYDWVLENHADSRTGKKVQSWYDVLKENDFRRTKSVEEKQAEIWKTDA